MAFKKNFFWGGSKRGKKSQKFKILGKKNTNFQILGHFDHFRTIQKIFFCKFPHPPHYTLPIRFRKHSITDLDSAFLIVLHQANFKSHLDIT